MSNSVRFYGSKPSGYDGLGYCLWELTDANCEQCGKIPLPDVILSTQHYDGYDWEFPVCPKCKYPLKGSLPVDEVEREIYLAKAKRSESQFKEEMS